MNAAAAGQAILEYLVLMALFAFFLGAIIHKIPDTFNSASPYLGAKIETRLESGQGFAGDGTWKPPVNKDGKGGAKQ
jgi:hypothetical protein